MQISKILVYLILFSPTHPPFTQNYSFWSGHVSRSLRRGSNRGQVKAHGLRHMTCGAGAGVGDRSGTRVQHLARRLSRCVGRGSCARLRAKRGLPGSLRTDLGRYRSVLTAEPPPFTDGLTGGRGAVEAACLSTGPVGF